TFANPTTQTFQRDFDIARAKLDGIVEILKFALIPDFDGAAVAAFMLADPHTFGIIAKRPEGRGSCRADPLIAALMALLLLFQPLAQRLHQLVKAAKRLDQLPVLIAQMFFSKL